MRRFPASPAACYLIALAAVVVATAIRLAFDPWLGGKYAFVLTYAAVGIAVWRAGTGPAVMAAALGYVTSSLLFVSPRGELHLVHVDDAYGLASYLASSGVLIGIGEALRKSRAAAWSSYDRLHRMLKASKLVAWEYDLQSRILTGTENFREFFNLPVQAPLEQCLEHIHPEDRRRHDLAIARAARRGGKYLALYRYVRPLDRQRVWIEDHGQLERDAAGRPVRLRGFALDVSDRMVLEEQIREQSRLIEEMSERKSRFIATFAHELRNPLHTVKTALRVLRTAAEGSERAASIIERQVDALGRMAEDLNDLALIENGKMRLKSEVCDIGDVLQMALESCSALLEAARHTVSVECPRGAVRARIDPDRIRQAVTNLLANAAKYTPPGGVIVLRGYREADHAVIMVSDNGIGIDAQHLQSIFAMFTQLNSESRSSHQGMGIGLSLVKHIVELHGGSIEADSGGRGRGTRFTIRLPARASASSDRVAA